MVSGTPIEKRCHMSNKRLAAICFITSTICFGVASIIAITSGRVPLSVVYLILAIFMLIMSIITWKKSK